MEHLRCWHCDGEVSVFSEGWVCQSCMQHGETFTEPASSATEGCTQNKPYSLTVEEKPTVEQLLGSLLDAQLQQNEMLGKLIHQLSLESQARQGQATAFAQWKIAHPQVHEQCKKALPSVDKFFTAFITRLMGTLEEVDEDNEFSSREFIDVYGPSLAQVQNLVQLFSYLSQ